MSDSPQYQYPITDLLDALTIEQIKEMLLPAEQNSERADSMKALAEDIEDALSARRVDSPGRLLRLIILLAQANLHVWHNKDRMSGGGDDYLPLLTHAQELNGLRNHVRNLMMALLDENTAANRRATFLETTEGRWYTPLVCQLTESNRTPAGRTRSMTEANSSASD